ncbi:LXG domain-containing protein [Shouchella clausii]|uniref:LXG domain-containing protein n=1 Tax=Shouchella clausii TaxID=79880 RepID=UPI00311D3342
MNEERSIANKKYVASDFFSALDKIDSDMNQYTETLSNVHSAIQGVVNLGDNLTGQGGEALKNFYANNHVPLLSYWTMACQQVKIATAKMRMNALSFESSDAVIDESFIEGEVIPQLEKNQRRIQQHQDRINGVVDSVSDIVSLPKIDTSAIQTGIHEAKQHAMNTVEKLYAFDYAQSAAVDQLISLMAPISSFIDGLNGAIESGVSITALAGYIASQDVPPEIKAMHPMLNGTYNVLTPYHNFKDQAVHTQNFLLSPNPFGFIHFSNPFIANVAHRFYLASGNIDVVHHYSPDHQIAGTILDANGNEIASSAYTVDAEIINDWGNGHIEVRGGKVDYDALEEQGIIPNRFVTNSGHSIHYTDIDGELVIFMDDPDVHYYTNAHK